MMPSVMNLMKAFNKDDEELHHMLESLQVFLDHLDELIGVFENDYTGGDFCAGLSFGFAGSNLLYKIAETIVT